MSKSILIATIGTRELAFRIGDKEWLNIGNDRSPDINTISEQAQVQSYLGLDQSDFRLLTEYLLESWSDYKNSIQPIILGKLLQDKQHNLKKIYLVCTNQPPKTPEKYRSKDTLYAAKLIQLWLKERYQITTEIVEQGNQGENPSDFESMFSWWKKQWNEIAVDVQEDTSLLLCLKGGVGQSSEAARITALGRFGENTYFYDFIQDEANNLLGKPSRYTQPFQGKIYLWERKQKEALAFLNRWDYSAVEKILHSYLKSSEDFDTQQIQKYLEMAIQWNMADFKNFAQLMGEMGKFRAKNWWWKAYEAAYLGVIRFRQGNTTEALFHSFRAVEGLASEWAIDFYKNHIRLTPNQSPALKKSVCSSEQHPQLQNFSSNFEGKSEIYLYGAKLNEILQITQPEINYNSDWQAFFYTARDWRNQIFHRLLKLEKREVFEAWNVTNQKQWESRILGCLNWLSKQNFNSLNEASLMFYVHKELEQAISSYQP